jgi:hypothetical protein
MPKRADVALAESRSGGKDEKVYSPRAVVEFAEKECRYVVGESTLRVWRARNIGPDFETDRLGNIWYRESVIRPYFIKKRKSHPVYSEKDVQQKRTLATVNDLLLHEMDPDPEVEPPKPPPAKKGLLSAKAHAASPTTSGRRPRLAAYNGRPRLSA